MKFKKLIAVLLCVIMAFSLGTNSFAASDETGSAYNPAVQFVDKLFGVFHDAIFGVLIKLTAQKNIPDCEEYAKTEHDGFYKGTDGTTKGSQWSGGFAQGSIIPAKWRRNADKKADENGYCLNTIKATGGYQTFVSKLYTDQNLHMIILSNGVDSNKNGVDDILIFISVDGVGITAGTGLDMRQNVEKALSSFGVTAEDILGINISATHCHAALDVQGMCIPTLFLNKLNPFSSYDRSLSKAMEDSICNQAFSCAKAAYSKLEKGKLYFFETGKVSGANDKLNSGVKTKNYFSCFVFEGVSGEKTILSNIGAHPTSYGAWDNNRLMCADYPYFMSLALADEGYNLVFTQSSQASVSSPSIDYEDGDEKDMEASEWIKTKALTKDDWVERYGKKYADKWYDKLEDSMRGHMKKGYLLAHFVLDASRDKTEVAPVLKVKNAQTLLSLDNGVMAWGSVSGLLGENVVKYSESETGYGVMVETNYIEIGNDVSILTAPGELSPALTYGSDENYTGPAKWTGKTSWAGKDWQYDTIENIVREATGDKDRTVLFFGITNDALGYMFPDINTPRSLLATIIFYKENSEDMTNCMLMTVGTSCGHELVESYTKIVNEE